MSDLETTLVVMSAFAVGGISVLGLVGWMVQSSVRTEAEGLHGRADHLESKSEEQAGKLAEVSADLHRARADLAAMKGLLENVKGEVDMIAHGPPSIRSPQGSKGRLS